jgi:DNA-binding beta-propeller fold protein YncE
MRSVIGSILALTAVIIVSSPAAADPKLLWETKGLANPESVVQDPLTGALYVSNVNGAVMQKDGNGFISKLSPEGKITVREWVKGLNGPAGLALVDRTLYVGDIDELVAINVASGEILKRYPAKGALFLNDVAAAPDGTVYVSDTPTNTIWRLKDGVFEPWLTSDELNGPNGLLVQDGKLIVASFGKLASEGQKEEKAAMLSVNIEDKKISKFGDGSPIGNLDGLESLVPGVYLVSDWNAGALYRIDSKGKATVLIDLNQGSADQTYLPDKKIVIIPMMLDSTLIAYELDE